MFICYFFFCFKQKAAYEMRISDWSSDVCSSDLQMKLCTLRLSGTLRGHDPFSPTSLVAAPARFRVGALCAGTGAATGHGGRRRDARTCNRPHGHAQIGRATWRERVCQYVKYSVVDVAEKKKKTETILQNT